MISSEQYLIIWTSFLLLCLSPSRFLLIIVRSRPVLLSVFEKWPHKTSFRRHLTAQSPSPVISGTSREDAYILMRPAGMHIM